jgi:hypothetical protein
LLKRNPRSTRADDQGGGPLLDLALAEMFECGAVDVPFVVERSWYGGRVA